MKIIAHILDPSDMVLVGRAAAYLLAQPLDIKNALLAYGEERTKDFYVKRSKSGISVWRTKDGVMVK